jgi:hypothetical protein
MKTARPASHPIRAIPLPLDAAPWRYNAKHHSGANRFSRADGVADRPSSAAEQKNEPAKVFTRR